MATTICTKCAKGTDKLSTFPGGICLECYEKQWEENNKGKTQQQIAQELYEDIVHGFGIK